MKLFPMHLRASTITGTLVALGATMAIALANGTSSPLQVSRFLDSFVLGAPNDLRDALNPLAGSHFDIVAYKAHPCYDIVGNEAQTCADQYGITESLRSMLENGRVSAHLRARGLLAAAPVPTAITVTPSPVAPEPTVVEKPAVTDALYQRLLVERGKRLWDACRGNAGSMRSANHCYARHMRLLTRFDVAIEGNVH